MKGPVEDYLILRVFCGPSLNLTCKMKGLLKTWRPNLFVQDNFFFKLKLFFKQVE